ncbi:MAG: PP2C family protein-serine/threonine phosphatase [Patescibacteria group bacterium]
MSVEYALVSAPLQRGGPNEDYVALCETGDQQPFLAVVVDGHGWEFDERGRRLVKSPTVAAFARDVALGVRDGFLQHGDAGALPQVFDEVARRVEAAYRPRTQSRDGLPMDVGAVASCVVVTRTHVHLAQTGDCRLYGALSGGWTVGYRRLSRDHNANNQSELRRLRPFLVSGEFRLLQPPGGNGLPRLPRGTPDRLHRRDVAGQVVAGPEPTRAFGDWTFCPAVTHVPECRSFELEALGDGELFALCSDGGNRFVEAAFERFRDVTRHVGLSTVADFVRAGLHKAHDDVSVVFFRVVDP